MYMEYGSINESIGVHTLEAMCLINMACLQPRQLLSVLRAHVGSQKMTRSHEDPII